MASELQMPIVAQRDKFFSIVIFPFRFINSGFAKKKKSCKRKDRWINEIKTRQRRSDQATIIKYAK